MDASVDPAAAGRKHRRPAWLPVLAALVFAVLTFWLGQWQLQRAEEKRARQAAFDVTARIPPVPLARLPEAFEPYTRVGVEGEFDAAHQIFIDNRVHRGRAGYHVITPLVHAGGVVLVNRGWLPVAPDRARVPLAAPPAGRVVLEGRILAARGRYVELAAGEDGPVWQNLDLDRFRHAYRRDLPDRLLLQTSPAADGLVRDWPMPGLGVDRHIGYAVQWFSLTGLILVLYGYFGLWRRFHGAR
ncbi:MAG: SURF1 family protein [Thiobacillaceae bacterium]|jgi:surfeit locus 1 family protein|nr:SURF1 family protein [Thiobacillaceae bacterium]